ncbi:MAG: helix-turn-helix transcriptional regulator [Candidatus Aphodousia sp.]|nr:helix-turn-helix domain-containing protein [Sutterella sp.]MDY2899084.1 helix-turn-helix transcriptional regulator [Candidatus Aphodousia sp.]
MIGVFDQEKTKALLKFRLQLGLTQTEVAKRMGTVQPAVARLEGKLNRGIYPSVTTLQKYAQAMGLTIDIAFVSPSTAVAAQEEQKA